MFLDDYQCCCTPGPHERDHYAALLPATKPLLLLLSLLFFYFPETSSPNLSSSLPLLPHRFSHLPLLPPHSLQRLCSDSYVWVERGLLLICAEWEKAVLAQGERAQFSLYSGILTYTRLKNTHIHTHTHLYVCVYSPNVICAFTDTDRCSSPHSHLSV